MELLCIETHPERAVIAGNSYPLIEGSCPCSCDNINVGIPGHISSGYKGLPMSECGACGEIFKYDGIWWIARRRFAPIATEDEVKESEKSKQEVLS